METHPSRRRLAAPTSEHRKHEPLLQGVTNLRHAQCTGGVPVGQGFSVGHRGQLACAALQHERLHAPADSREEQRRRRGPAQLPRDDGQLPADRGAAAQVAAEHRLHQQGQEKDRRSRFRSGKRKVLNFPYIHTPIYLSNYLSNYLSIYLNGLVGM